MKLPYGSHAVNVAHPPDRFNADLLQILAHNEGGRLGRSGHRPGLIRIPLGPPTRVAALSAAHAYA